MKYCDKLRPSMISHKQNPQFSNTKRKLGNSICTALTRILVRIKQAAKALAPKQKYNKKILQQIQFILISLALCSQCLFALYIIFRVAAYFSTPCATLGHWSDLGTKAKKL